MSATQKSERPVAAGRDANEITETGHIVEERDTDRKAFATLQAQFALRGYALTRACRVPDGHTTYIVARWERSRAFGQLSELRAFLARAMESAL